MAYKNKTYIAFDGDNDLHYYRMMTAWSENPRFSFEFYNAHDLNSARDSSSEESIKRQLRVRFANSKVFVLLIGNNTRYLTKFVKWEIEVAIKLDIPIIAANLNGSKRKDNLCPPALDDSLAIFVPFGAKIIEHAMVNWPEDHRRCRATGDIASYHYRDHAYESLGL